LASPPGASRSTPSTAERGVYRANSFRGADLTFRGRYFHASPHARSFTLDPSVRATVRFTRGNLLDPHLLSDQPPYDVIFCRNVLIYLDSSSRRRAFATLDRLLAPAGLLFVGHAERVTIDDSCFVPWGENASFTLHRATGPLRKPVQSPARSPQPAKIPPPYSLKRPDLGRASRPSKDQPKGLRSSDPSKPAPMPVAESAATLLDEASTLADQGRHDEAATRCEAVLGRYGPNSRAFFLLGLIRQAGGRLAEAEACFRKTIYLEPGHDEALFALALIAQRRDDPAAAAGYRRRAERARAKKGTA
jgi:chemotaxis protein methyltransferase WspC